MNRPTFRAFVSLWLMFCMLFAVTPICLGWKGKRKGKIYFWDHEDELDEDGDFVQDYRNVFLVANSLQEFLDSLMTLEEFEKRPRRERM